MVKKKRIVSKLILALVVLTAISCCFLGSTFARYTSGGTGSATVEVAKWDISFGEEGATTITFDGAKLSPAKDAWDAENATTPRSNSTKKVAVTISNNGDVDALVTVTLGAETVTSSILFGQESGITSDTYTDPTVKPTQKQVEDLFSLDVYYSKANIDAEADAATDKYQFGTTEVVVPAGEQLKLYICVTWTSADVDDETSGKVADAIDTWVGQNVTSVAYDLTFTAVQNSVLPNA